MAVAKPKSRQYEAMFLFGPQSADANAYPNLVRGLVEKHGGTVIVLKRWDERRLAFEVRKQKRGTYVIAYFNAPSAAITPLEREAKLNEDVLRVLVTDAAHLNEQEMNAVEPQPIIREPERAPWDRPPEREGRGGDRGDRGGDRGGRGPRREEATADAGGKD